MIRCTNISKTFGSIEAVNDISFELGETEFLSILGPSGCGKSTLLRLIAGLESPDNGRVSLYDQEISTTKKLLPPEKRRFGMVFQDFALFPHMSVASNIAYGLRGSKEEKRSRVSELLELVNLPNLGDHMPHQLSGGEQQRVAVARSLAPNPRLILMDEPFSNLDYQLRVQLRREIREILRHQGVACILVTHDQNEAITFSERVLLMNSGELVQIGSPNEVYRSPINLWAASFVGEANLIQLERQKEDVVSPLGKLKLKKYSVAEVQTLMIRPEAIQIKKHQDHFSNGSINSVEFAGPVQNIIIVLNNGQILHAICSPERSWAEGDTVSILIEHCQCYNQEGLLLEGSDVKLIPITSNS